jgi:hypothetical protein
MRTPVAYFAILAITLLNVYRSLSQLSALRASLSEKAYSTTSLLFVSVPLIIPEGYHGTEFPSELQIGVRHAVMWFKDTDRYALNATADWESVLPPGNGWVKLGSEDRPFSISMYHQLHCLNGIRNALSLTINDAAAAQVRSHTNHCFNYMRQLLLCKADTTLEPAETVQLPDGTVAAFASGLMVGHICRDWTEVREFIELNTQGWLGKK